MPGSRCSLGMTTQPNKHTLAVRRFYRAAMYLQPPRLSSGPRLLYIRIHSLDHILITLLDHRRFSFSVYVSSRRRM